MLVAEPPFCPTNTKKNQKPLPISKCHLAVSMACDGLSKSPTAPISSSRWLRHTGSPQPYKNSKATPLQMPARPYQRLGRTSLTSTMPKSRHARRRASLHFRQIQKKIKPPAQGCANHIILSVPCWLTTTTSLPPPTPPPRIANAIENKCQLLFSYLILCAVIILQRDVLLFVSWSPSSCAPLPLLPWSSVACRLLIS